MSSKTSSFSLLFHMNRVHAHSRCQSETQTKHTHSQPQTRPYSSRGSLQELACTVWHSTFGSRNAMAEPTNEQKTSSLLMAAVQLESPVFGYSGYHVHLSTCRPDARCRRRSSCHTAPESRSSTILTALHMKLQQIHVSCQSARDLMIRLMPNSKLPLVQ